MCSYRISKAMYIPASDELLKISCKHDRAHLLVLNEHALPTYIRCRVLCLLKFMLVVTYQFALVRWISMCPTKGRAGQRRTSRGQGTTGQVLLARVMINSRVTRPLADARLQFT
jgi:hypothetical protein